MVVTEENITSFLDDLGGDEREIIIPGSNPTMDKLNAVRDQLFEEFNDDTISTGLQLFIKEEHQKICERLDKLTNNLQYEQEDLKNFIFENSNLDIDILEPVLGVYTAYLLDKLNLDFFYINGLNNQFNYLFCNSKNCKNLIIENFSGFNIGLYISTTGLLAYINNKGKNIGLEVGYDGKTDDPFYDMEMKGRTNNVFFINNKGKQIGFSAAHATKASFIAFINNEGEYTAKSFCEHGDIDTLFALNNKGDYFGKSIAEYGKINNLILKDNKGINPLNNLDHNDTKIENAYLINNENIGYINSHCIKNCYVYNKIPQREHPNNNFTKEDVMPKFHQFLLQKNLIPVIKIANNPDQCTGEDFAKYLVKISEEIR
ncbi:hypothetical protein ACFL1H_05560 [Nanoarchaeota archaeon]